MYTRLMDDRILEFGVLCAQFVMNQKGDRISDCQLVICCGIFFELDVQQIDTEQ